METKTLLAVLAFSFPIGCLLMFYGAAYWGLNGKSSKGVPIAILGLFLVAVSGYFAITT